MLFGRIINQVSAPDGSKAIAETPTDTKAQLLLRV